LLLEAHKLAILYGSGSDFFLLGFLIPPQPLTRVSYSIAVIDSEI
jgi:hypothetical protein